MTNRSSRPKKSLGQNFLMHPAIARRIASVAGLPESAIALEVGPGRGILTEALLQAGARVIAVEADGALIPGLAERFENEIADGRLTLVHADIRDVLKHPQKYAIAQNRGYHVVANIPYYLTGELIRELLSRAHQPASMTLLVQKEVAERIARDKKESLLSLSVKAYGTPKYEFTVPRGAFRPAPRVNSAVLSVRAISRARFGSKKEEGRFFELIRAGFAHKRKRLAKNLADAGLGNPSVEPNTRAEDLSLTEWLALAKSPYT